MIYIDQIKACLRIIKETNDATMKYLMGVKATSINLEKQIKEEIQAWTMTETEVDEELVAKLTNKLNI